MTAVPPTGDAPPQRPGQVEENWASRLFYGLAPRLPRVEQPLPSDELAPWSPLEVPRSATNGRRGRLAATWYPAAAPARGAVLFLHPWTEWGKSYFHRRGRLEVVRAAGYHALAIDFPDFGGSDRRRGFADLDVEDALLFLAARCPDLPVVVWGVSAGGYWAHPALARVARRVGVRAAFFEDVSPHLIEWSRRVAPAGRPAFGFFELAFRQSYAFLDMRRHAPHLGLAAVAYVSGGEDRGVRPEDTAALAARAGGVAVVVPEAGHLAAIRRAGDEVCGLALDTFARGAAAR